MSDDQESTEDPQIVLLREALRSLRDETPTNKLARASILAAVQDNPALFAIALQEITYHGTEEPL